MKDCGGPLQYLRDEKDCAIVSMFAGGDMARRRGRQKGTLKVEGPSWMGYWNETVRAVDGSESWHKFSRAIGPKDWTRKKAQREFDEAILYKLDTATQCPQSLATVTEFVERKYKPDVLRGLKPNTQIQYRSLLARHILPAVGAKRLRDVRREHVQSLVWAKVDARLSSRTVAHIRKVVSAVFDYAITINYFSGDNPASHLRMPERRDVRAKTAYTYDQAQRLLEFLDSPEREMVLTALCTSMNVAELCGLRWRYVNLTDQFSLVDGDAIPPFRAAVRWNFTAGQFGSVKTGNRNRTVPLPQMVVEALRALKESSAFSGLNDSVFTSRNGTPIDGNNVRNRAFKRAGDKLGFHVNWHAFRHTAATWAEAAGMVMSDRVALMGHGGARMTQYYTHEDLNRQSASVEKMAEGLRSKVIPIRKGA
jgi:ATP-dependent helicase/nuclease subunit A